MLKDKLQPIKGRFTSLAGFRNIFVNEIYMWSKGRTKYFSIYLAIFITLPGILSYFFGNSSGNNPGSIILFLIVIPFLLKYLVIVTFHNTLNEGLSSGVMQWILSKPVSKSSIILGKFFANVFMFWFVVVFVHLTINYIFTLFTADVIRVSFQMYLNILLHFLLLISFYSGLVLLISVFTKNSKIILGLILIYTLIEYVIVDKFAFLYNVLPYGLENNISNTFARGSNNYYGLTLLSVSLISIFFVALTIVKFEREVIR